MVVSGSTIGNCTPWLEPIGRPNTTRSEAYAAVAFGIWLTMLLHARGGEILRIKGLLDVGGAGPLLVNCVQHAVYPPVHLDAWPDEDHRSRLVFIGQDVDRDALETSLRAFNKAAGSASR